MITVAHPEHSSGELKVHASYRYFVLCHSALASCFVFQDFLKKKKKKKKCITHINSPSEVAKPSVPLESN